MNIETIADSIWTALERGEAALKNPVTRCIVDDDLRRNQILQNPQDFDARTLMKEFFTAYIRDWPNPMALEYVEPHLEALRDLRAAMNVNEINEHVAVFVDPCRIEDRRQSLTGFKGVLKELVLHEWEQPPLDKD